MWWLFEFFSWPSSGYSGKDIRSDHLPGLSVNRNLTNSQIEVIGNGEFYLGSEALRFGMVDELGSKDEVLSYIEKEIGEEPKLKRIEHSKSFLDVLAGVINGNGFKITNFNEGISLT